MTTQPLRRAGGVFAQMHQALMDIDIPFHQLDPSTVPTDMLGVVQATWQHRVTTEYRSIQIMTRFMTEILGAGDPLDVYAGAVDMIEDEIRHTALCAEVVRALGEQPMLPEPVSMPESDAFLAMPMMHRSLATAISMLAVNETLSCGFIEDLANRCDHPVIGAVLKATIADEEGHEAFGWEYIRKSLTRFPEESLSEWQAIAQQALTAQRSQAMAVLNELPADKRTLEAWPDTELVQWGLFSPQRQALVYEKTYNEVLEPHMKELNLF
jgi:hypothetical protein